MLVISLWIATAAWTGFIVLNTVLDADRSEKVADTLLEDDEVRAQLEANMAAAVRRALPPGAPVTDAQLEAGASAALDSPAVSGLFRDAFVQTHRAFLGEGEPPCCLDLGGVASSVRQGVIDRNPGLEGSLPEAPTLVVDLPTERIPDMSAPKDWLQRIVPLLAGAAALGVIAAFVIARNRSRILRRAGIWAVFASAVWLALSFGVPWLAEQLFDGQAAVMAALIEAMAGTMTAPSLALAAAGAGLIVSSFIWKAAGAFDGGGAPPAAPPAPQPSYRPAVPPPPRPLPTRDEMARARAREASDGADATRVHGADATTQIPRAGAAGSPAPAEPAEPLSGSPTRSAKRRWVPGHGYVVDFGETPPPDAKWVEGVGWVLPSSE